MAEDSSTEKVNPRLVAEIVSSYVGKTSIAVDQIGPHGWRGRAVVRTLRSGRCNRPAETRSGEPRRRWLCVS